MLLQKKKEKLCFGMPDRNGACVRDLDVNMVSPRMVGVRKRERTNVGQRWCVRDIERDTGDGL